MGATKAEEFSVKDNRLSKYAKALAHPARVAILKILLKRNACICGDIVEELPLSQSTVSQHLKELKEAGLIKGQIEGIQRMVEADADTPDILMQVVSARQALKSFSEEVIESHVLECIEGAKGQGEGGREIRDLLQVLKRYAA